MTRVMGWIGSLLLLFAGCGFSSPRNAGGPDGGNGGGDGGGGGPDGSSGCTAWTPLARHVVPCDLPAKPAWIVSAPGGTFDTTTGTYSAGSAPESTTIVQDDDIVLRVVSVEAFTVAPGATLRVIGTHPLLVLSWDGISVAGTIDAGSARNGANVEKGAGADRVGCQAPQSGDGTQDCGGGGGGGFSNGGGKGGDGANGGNNGGNGAGSIAAPTIVAGGCPGAEGGEGGSAGAGGAGGGAIQLTAKTMIAIAPTGRINAGGAGGRAGQGDGGGGGGGSGGFIGLDAPTVTVSSGAVLAANGGGGGTGCDGGTGGASGGNGALSTARASGGSSGCSDPVSGGRGGALGSSTEMKGENGASGGGGVSGGGGGGGVGYILVWSLTPSFQGTASPAHQAASPL